MPQMRETQWSWKKRELNENLRARPHRHGISPADHSCIGDTLWEIVSVRTTVLSSQFTANK